MNPLNIPDAGDDRFQQWQNEWFHCPHEEEERRLHRQVLDMWHEARRLDAEDGLDDASSWRCAEHIASGKKEARATYTARRMEGSDLPHSGRVYMAQLMA